MKLDFPCPKNVGVIIQRQIVKGEKPILRIYHDTDDGMWQFLCDDEVDIKDGMMIALSEAFQIDNTISQVADLPLGWVAWRRSPGTIWHRQKIDDIESSV